MKKMITHISMLLIKHIFIPNADGRLKKFFMAAPLWPVNTTTTPFRSASQGSTGRTYSFSTVTAASK